MRTGFKKDEIINIATKLNKMDAIRIKGIMVMPDVGLTDAELVNQFDNAYIIYKEMTTFTQQYQQQQIDREIDWYSIV